MQENPVEADEVLDQVLRLTDPSAYAPEADPWVSRAKEIVENAIDRLVREFLECPYLHRVEHSIHAQLFALLTAEPGTDFAQRHPIGSTGAVTQLVHKEWPETIARPGARRGNFDLAVLSPELLRGCPSLEWFRQGRLAAPLVIEMGLDYDAAHLAGDAAKLMNSRPTHGYLIHLVREVAKDPSTEQILLHLEEKTGIRTAYGRVAGEQKAYKLVSDKGITETA